MSNADIVGYSMYILLILSMLAMIIFCCVLLVKAIKMHKCRLKEEETPEGRRKWFLDDLEFHLKNNQVILENFEDHVRELRGEKDFYRSDRETDTQRITRIISWTIQLIDSGVVTVRDLKAYLTQEIQRFEASRSRPDIIKYGPLIT